METVLAMHDEMSTAQATDQIIKTLHLAESRMYVSGFPDDPYFVNAQQHLSGSLLLAAILIHHVGPGSTIIDAGANCGIVTAMMNALVADATILSLEPGRVFSCLEATARANAMAKQRSFKCCVGTADGSTGFLDASDSSASHIGGADLPQTVVRSLDSIAAEAGISRCDFVKIDVEGFEGDVLDGMRHINETYKPLIFMEFNSYTIAARKSYSPRILLERILSEFGCFLSLVSPEGTDLAASRSDVLSVLHRNMTQRNCVEDIVFSADPSRIAAFRLP